MIALLLPGVNCSLIVAQWLSQVYKQTKIILHDLDLNLRPRAVYNQVVCIYDCLKSIVLKESAWVKIQAVLKWLCTNCKSAAYDINFI